MQRQIQRNETRDGVVEVENGRNAKDKKKEDFSYVPGIVFFQPPESWTKPGVPEAVQEAIDSNRLVPTEEYVLVWVMLEEKTKGGLYIPDEAKNRNRSFRAYIIALGPDAKAEGFEVGQCVIISQYAGVMLPERNAAEKSKPLDMVRARDILALDYRGDA
jgi:co-chaperonin GroES (HSP10)